MVSALNSGSGGPGSSPGRGTALCSWVRNFTLIVPLSTQVATPSKFTAGGSPAMDQHPIQGGVELLLVASCYRNRDKLWPDGPLGSYADLIPYIQTIKDLLNILVYFVGAFEKCVAGMCGSRKYPYSPHRRDWKFRGGGGVSKTQKFKAMYEAKLKFPEGWGGHRANPFRGGYGYFLEPHNSQFFYSRTFFLCMCAVLMTVLFVIKVILFLEHD